MAKLKKNPSPTEKARTNEETVLEELPENLLKMAEMVPEQPLTLLSSEETTSPSAVTSSEKNPLPTDIPSPTSPEWTTFLMSQLLPDEQYDGRPRIEGLRRLCRLYYGDVVSSISRVVQPPNQQNNFHNCCEHHLTLDCYDGVRRTFSGVADTSPFSGDANFARLAATCETISESRAYRKALQLRGVCTAEEIPVLPYEDPNVISPTDLQLIDLIASRSNINVKEFMRHYKDKNNIKTKWGKISSIPSKDAKAMIDLLTFYQREPNAVPSTVHGYESNWNGSN